MKHICILCDRSYQPNKQQQKKLTKFPQLIQICADCSTRITNKVLARTQKAEGSLNDRPNYS